MTDDVLAEQLAYYRQRASEYDATAYGDVSAAGERIGRLVRQLDPSGQVLEIACGTGMWTGALAHSADQVLATDAAAEVLAIARARVPAANVTFEIADIFTWDSPHRFDTIFFSAWLSHVPDDRFTDFWHRLSTLLAPEGRVLFIDEHPGEQGKERYLAGEVVQRQLADGSRHRIVKNFIDPDQVTGRLATLGWSARISRDGADWIVGQAQPTRT